MNSTIGEIVRDRLSEDYGDEGFLVLCLTKHADILAAGERTWSDPHVAEQRLHDAAAAEETTVSNDALLYMLYYLGRKQILWALLPS